ncbi:hypothetical protein G6L37_01275 [Agrobacterium rubi]|nr:hypothetical protein [Agrobacterium rubi]NTF24023.1 hypothetical protein [Agrobacterium rubi]
MPDSNPTLTASLMGERNSLMSERADILRQMTELNSLLDMNSTQIEATDTLMLRFNTDHVSIDVRNDLEGSPLVVVQRTPLQLESSTSATAIEQATAPVQEPETTEAAEATSTTEPKAEKAEAAKSPKKKSAAPKKAAKLTTEEEAAAVDAAVAAKPGRTPEMQAIAEYFQKSKRNETILQILRGMDEPVSSSAVAGHYRALYPLPNDSAQIRTLHNSRISSALHYLKDRGQAKRIAEDKADGARADNVLWELSKSYRSEIRKSRASTKTQLNGHASASKSPVDSAQISGTTH